MDYFFNEKSFHGQFHSVEEFQTAVERVMEIRQEIRRFQAQLFFHSGLASAQITSTMNMHQASQRLPQEKRQAWIQWLSQQGGPFWSDERHHSGDDWLETDRSEIVTDTAIGEVAFRTNHGLAGELVSVDPSDWLRDRIRVFWQRNEAECTAIDIINHWEKSSVNLSLSRMPRGYDSWVSLFEYLRSKCNLVTFAEDAFMPLHGIPFSPGAADRIDVLSSLLNTLLGCVDEYGNRSKEGHRIFKDHFGHDKAWFTDSSDSEKSEFKDDMTFQHPAYPNRTLFCTWHGKVKIGQIRIHFAWPTKSDNQLYITYVGPKITKR